MEETPMQKHAAATALAIGLINIAMLTPAVFGKAPIDPRREEDCDGWRPDWGRRYAIRCHCSFECRQQYSYTVRLPCTPRPPGYDESPSQPVSGIKGLCDRRAYPIETVHACLKACVKAKEAAQH
jgi:hypothetical protein